MKLKRNSLYIGGLVALAVVAVLVVAACKAKTPAAQAAKLSLEDVTAVMGTASGSSSGASEMTQQGDTYIINYHLMLPSKQDYDVLIGTDMAPKIQKLYQTYKALDKVTFTVETGDMSNPANMQPYCEFDMTRKIYEQLNWTNLLARDLFKVCKVNYH
jgi:hypothetical protein